MFGQQLFFVLFLEQQHLQKRDFSDGLQVLQGHHLMMTSNHLQLRPLVPTGQSTIYHIWYTHSPPM